MIISEIEKTMNSFFLRGFSILAFCFSSIDCGVALTSGRTIKIPLKRKYLDSTYSKEKQRTFMDSTSVCSTLLDTI
ncbi:hypothetical protein LEP1GSC194_1740 [Leptospira alstonii serovar Sichuan str. 79601]|uniref:Uncharacterized protein n=1 Tax=Leptospira alstonii serovar Sichuan str. 79601 TaxID=1218565 RepID=M6CXH5_9LEPT|nr:hypothetical protein LEP1GSC194_1740 [Leptospira alstonii serovar Sichuan str. 79601]